MAKLVDAPRRTLTLLLYVALGAGGFSEPLPKRARGAEPAFPAAAQDAEQQDAEQQGPQPAGESAAPPDAAGDAPVDPAMLPWRRRNASVGQPGAVPRVVRVGGFGCQPMALFRDGEPWTQDLQEPLIKVLFRLPQIEAADIVRWRRPESLAQMLADPDAYRLDVAPLQGRLKQVVRRDAIPELARSYDISEYFEAQVRDAQGRLLLVNLRQAPEAWLRASALDEPVEFDGLFLQGLPASPDSPPGAAFAAQRLRWKPERTNSELGVTDSVVRLAALGVDAANFETVRNVIARR